MDDILTVFMDFTHCIVVLLHTGTLSNTVLLILIPPLKTASGGQISEVGTILIVVIFSNSTFLSTILIFSKIPQHVSTILIVSKFLKSPKNPPIFFRLQRAENPNFFAWRAEKHPKKFACGARFTLRNPTL